MNDRVSIAVAEDGVAAVTLTRGDRHNAMDFAMLDAVRGAARKLRRDRRVRAVILRGDGP
jgi:enoyl-CoA hydratase/carnithine racemase